MHSSVPRTTKPVEGVVVSQEILEKVLERSVRSSRMGDFLGIAGYSPDWHSDPASFRSSHASALGAILGSELNAAWILWDTTHDEHFTDAPVILEFDSGPRVEVCCWKFDEMSVTYDSIDFNATMTWDWEPRAFEWRREALPAFAPVLGSQLRALDLIEIELVAAGSTWAKSRVVV